MSGKKVIRIGLIQNNSPFHGILLGFILEKFGSYVKEQKKIPYN